MTSLADHKHELLLAHAGLTGETAVPGATLIMALLRTTALIDRACAAELAGFNLTEGRLSVMLAVAERSSAPDGASTDATPARIADDLGVSRAAVTGLLDGLEQQGLVERRASSSDRRSTTIGLTAAGRETLDSIGPAYGSWLRELAAGISPEVARGALGAMSTLQHTLGREAHND